MEIIDWLNQNDGFFLVLLTAVYALTTILLVRKMAKSNEIAQRNINVFTELEKDKNRPSIILTIEPIKTVLLQVRIKNIGVSTAFNISIQSKPKIRRLKDDENIKFISEGIPSLPPGAELTSLIGTFNEYKEKFKDEPFSGYIEYSRLDDKKYKEEFHIDLSVYEGITFIREKSIDDLVKEVEKIRRDLGHLISGFKKPLVRTIAENKYQEEQKRRYIEAEQQMLKKHERDKKASNEEE